MTRYVDLADTLAAAIRSGGLRAGDRLPSMRQLRTAHGVSASTVFQAYYLLEARGLVRARPRSGYFVTAQASARPLVPQTASAPRKQSIAVDVGDHVFDILAATMRRDVVPLGSAFPSPALFPLARLARAMAASVTRLDPRSSVDYLVQGSLPLRRHIARRYLADGMDMAADDLVVTTGAMEALNLCLAAVTRPGDAVAIESPTFYVALQALQRRGLKALELPTHPADGIDLEALDAQLSRGRVRAVWLMTNFQNPLGSLMPEAKKRALVALLARHDVPLIEDDVYGELHYAARRPLPAKAFDERGLVLHCASFSKCLAPGYRIGWAAAGRYTQAIARMKLSATLTASVPAESALAAYLERGGYDRHLRALRQALAAQQEAMLAAIARHFPAGTRATRPAGGYFTWVELPRHVDTLALHAQALARGISIAPGPIFSSRGEFAHCLRLNHGHPWTPRMEAAMATLGKLIAQQA